MTIKKQLGLRIQELRLKRGLKQSELAEKVGIATKHQSCIETGKNFPSAELIEKFAVVLKVDISEILNIKHIKDRSSQIIEITKMLETANDCEVKIIYKFVNSLLN